MTDDRAASALDDTRSAEVWSPAPPFPVAAPLTGGALDRAAELRGRPEDLATLWTEDGARVLALWRGKAPIQLADDGARLAWAPATDALRAAAREAPVLLGRALGAEGARDGRFAVDLSEHETPEALGFWPSPPKYIDLRSIGPELAAGEGGIYAEAKSLIEWHATHPRCARCGAATELTVGGWRRDCLGCGAKHFPRTDPVAIMLATRVGADGLERVILGRQPNWIPKMHSLLAGYVEPGETFEEAACREVREEAGVEVGRAAYLACQPWPFPSTLMIGVWVEVLSDELHPDYEELESCVWATREEVRAALTGAHPALSAPRVDAIARTLVEAWATGAMRTPIG